VTTRPASARPPAPHPSWLSNRPFRQFKGRDNGTRPLDEETFGLVARQFLDGGLLLGPGQEERRHEPGPFARDAQSSATSRSTIHPKTHRAITRVVIQGATRPLFMVKPYDVGNGSLAPVDDRLGRAGAGSPDLVSRAWRSIDYVYCWPRYDRYVCT
jgi:hypothetical protein